MSVTCIGGLSVVCVSDCVPPTWFGLNAIVVVEFGLPMPNDGALVVVVPLAGLVVDDVELEADPDGAPGSGVVEVDVDEEDDETGPTSTRPR